MSARWVENARRSARRGIGSGWLASFGVTAVSGLFLCACGSEPPPGLPPGPPPVPTCDEPDPAVKLPDDACGVFVSASLGDDENPGTRALPVKTLKRATEEAALGTHRVYACGEPFQEFADFHGVDFWGGFDCASGWAYRGTEARTTITRPDKPYETCEVDVEGAQGRTTTVTNLRVVAKDGVERGTLSCALMVNGKFAVRIVGSELIGGKGAFPGGSSAALRIDMDGGTEAAVEVVDSRMLAGDGADGDPGDLIGGTTVGESQDGHAGVAACSSDQTTEFPDITYRCGDEMSIAGRGGAGAEDRGLAGSDGQPAPNPNPTEAGVAGLGQTTGACTDGHTGLPGADGANGQGARGPLSFYLIKASAYVANSGGDGTPGRIGQGGGGGGGSRGGAACGPGPQRGASGGFGGVGGCGGHGGQGGTGGGVSVGILVRGGTLTVRGTSIQTGHGGDGAAGHAGEPGAAGGSGGAGGAGVPGALVAGCRGGEGGKGGAAGHGGGGLGGTSAGIVYEHTLVLDPARIEATIELGTPGKGGLGGDPSIPLQIGEDGVSADHVPFIVTEEDPRYRW